MGYGGEKRVAQALPLGVEARSLCSFGQLRARDRNPDLTRERLQEMALLREQHAALIARQHRQYTEPLLQRQIQAWRRWKRVGTQAGTLAVIDNPLSHRQIGMPKGNGETRIAWVLEVARRGRKQNHRLALENLRDVIHRHPGETRQ